MADQVSRPFLVGGERMKERVVSSRGGGPKSHRFTYAQARERLLPQVRAVRSRAVAAGDSRSTEFVFAATLWPEYLAASYFPDDLLGAAGLDLVGSRPARRERITAKRVQPDALTKTLFLAGSDEDLTRLEAILSSAAPDEDSDDRLWGNIRALSDITVPDVGDVFRDRGMGLDGNQAANAIQGTAPEGRRMWECVMHRTRAVEQALALFAEQVSEEEGETHIEDRLEAGGLIYLSAWLSDVAARRIASFNPLRAVRPLPEIRPVVPYAFRAVGLPAVLPAVDGTPVTEHRVAIFDGGVDETCPTSSAATRVIHLTSASPDPEAVAHGSVVTNAVLFGYVPHGETLRQPEVGVDHYRIWPPPRTERLDPDLYWILRQIRDVVSTHEYRIVVLCVAPDQEVDESTPHPWTAVLDDLAHASGTLFVVAAGNSGHHPPETGLHRVQVPADMANALGVGAATTRREESKKWDRAPYSSYGPGRPGGIMQPLVLQFGGTHEAPFLGIGTAGTRVVTMGTSFAAPLVGHGVAGALAAVGRGQATAAFLRALAVHATERRRPHLPASHSYGRTMERFDSLWNCAQNEVTLLYADSLERHTAIALPLPIPDGLPEDTVLKIRCTAAFQTRVDATDPVDYSLSAITWTFRPNIQLYTFRLKHGTILKKESWMCATRTLWKTCLKADGCLAVLPTRET